MSASFGVSVSNITEMTLMSQEPLASWGPRQTRDYITRQEGKEEAALTQSERRAGHSILKPPGAMSSPAKANQFVTVCVPPPWQLCQSIFNSPRERNAAAATSPGSF